MEYVVRKLYLDVECKHLGPSRSETRHSELFNGKWFDDKDKWSVDDFDTAEEMELIPYGDVHNVRFWDSTKGDGCLYDVEIMYLTEDAWKRMSTSPELDSEIDALSEELGGDDFVYQAERALIKHLGGNVSNRITVKNKFVP